jgi:transposase, IS5 family
VPDESTVRKLTRRIGEQTVNDVTRALIEAAVRERRFRARVVRIDSTVIEADIRYPTDVGLASHGVKPLAREGRKLASKLGETKVRVRDHSRSMGPQAARDLKDDPPPQRGSEGRGARSD